MCCLCKLRSDVYEFEQLLTYCEASRKEPNPDAKETTFSVAGSQNLKSSFDRQGNEAGARERNPRAPTQHLLDHRHRAPVEKSFFVRKTDP
ncbi:hypothetical protein BPOR_1596g00010 [Botrytis porri]|uniref:Uncharacterized protein n=1 Tax=Botrytis porri TaxID=87229 RepID=A0A4Z1K9S0_9HELO|nr:hypothetical protein BPOR_1596g00010 [Botrytis porri]